MLTRPAIEILMTAGLIRVTPDPVKIGPNSIDLRLGQSLKTYHPAKNRLAVADPVTGSMYAALDPRNPPPLVDVPRLSSGGWLLIPGHFYLGVTLEETYCRGVIPHLDGRSTCGRLSIEAHKTAGVGDNGFQGRWTLEIEVTEPVVVHPGDRLFQVYFSPAWGSALARLLVSQDKGWFLPRWLRDLLDPHTLYGGKTGHHYQASDDVRGPSPLDDE